MLWPKTWNLVVFPLQRWVLISRRRRKKERHRKVQLSLFSSYHYKCSEGHIKNFLQHTKARCCKKFPPCFFLFSLSLSGAFLLLQLVCYSGLLYGIRSSYTISLEPMKTKKCLRRTHFQSRNGHIFFPLGLPHFNLLFPHLAFVSFSVLLLLLFYGQHRISKFGCLTTKVSYFLLPSACILLLLCCFARIRQII